MRKRMLAGVVLVGALSLAIAGCSGSTTASGTGSASAAGGAAKPIKVGFAQTGSESGWRSANTESMKAAFSKENGFDLTFNAADNDPAAQIAAVRSFINQKVDAIVMAPIVTDGWDDVLKEAQAAKIPVVLEDRTVSSPDSMFASWVGLDFKKEGVTAGTWAKDNYGDKDTKMVVLEGTTGSAPANDRAAGFDQAIAGSKIKKIDVLYAHNDDMGLGAIEAIEGAGLKPGVDIKIITIDAVHDGMQALADGKINYIVECNPLLGELAAGLVKDTVAGKPTEKKTYVQDASFTKDQAAAVIADRKY